jgi:hypothetical protein
MKQFACWFTHGVGNGSELRRIVHAAQKPAEILESVERFFENRSAVSAQDVESLASAQGDDGQIVIAQHAGNVGLPEVNRNEDPAHGPSEQHLACESTRGT